MAERVDLAVGVRQCRPDLGATVLERQDAREPRRRPRARSSGRARQRRPVRALGRRQRGEASLMTLRVHDDLAGAERGRQARIGRVGDGRRIEDERGKSVVEDRRVVAEGELRPTWAERAAVSLGEAAGQRPAARRRRAMRANVARRRDRHPRGRQLVSAEVEVGRLRARRFGPWGSADVAVDMNSPSVGLDERRSGKRLRRPHAVTLADGRTTMVGRDEDVAAVIAPWTVVEIANRRGMRALLADYGAQADRALDSRP